jgi:WD40 repeat protein
LEVNMKKIDFVRGGSVFINVTLLVLGGLAWHRSRPEPVPTLYRHRQWVEHLAFAPDGMSLVSSGGLVEVDTDIIVWDIASGTAQRTLSGLKGCAQACAFAPKAQLLAAGGWGGTIKLWDTSTGNELKTLSAGSDLVSSVAFSPDGSRLLSSLPHQDGRVWDIAIGDVVGRFPIQGSFATSADGRTLAGIKEGRALILLDSVTLQEKTCIPLPQRSFGCFALSPDGQTLAVALNSGETIGIWDALTRELRFQLQGHSEQVRALAFSPDGRTLASGGNDRTVRLWDVISGEGLGVLGKHERGVTTVSFAPDGRQIASGGYDMTVRLWKLES